MSQTISDLLGLGSIDDGIKHGGELTHRDWPEGCEYDGGYSCQSDGSGK